MDITRLTNKRGYFFDGYTLLIGYISGGNSVYCRQLSGKVIYDRPIGFGFRSWYPNYKYDNWDISKFEFIPSSTFRGLKGYLEFIDNATYEEIRMYFKLKEVMNTEDFKNFKISL